MAAAAAALMGLIFAGAMATAIVSDIASMTIRNRVSLALVAGFVLLAPLVGLPLPLYGWNLAAGALMLAVTFGCFCIGAMGGGDAKLIAATALWLGFDPSLADYLVRAALLGGALTLILLAYRRMPCPALAGRYAFLRTLARKDVGVPYGVALGAAGLWTFPHAPVGAAVLRLLGL